MFDVYKIEPKDLTATQTVEVISLILDHLGLDVEKEDSYYDKTLRLVKREETTIPEDNKYEEETRG